METTYQAVAISGLGAPADSPNFALVVALLALGVQPLPTCPVVETIEEIDGKAVHQHTWLFYAKSDDGHETDKLRKWWNDPEWIDTHPDHPLAQLRVQVADHALITKALRIEAWLREELKNSVPLAVVRKGSKRVMIPIDATPEEEAAQLARLK